MLKNTEVSQEKNLKVDHLLSRLNLMTLETIDYNKDTSINNLNDIAKLKPGKSAQIAAKKISQKYKKIRSKKPPFFLS